LCAWGVWKSVVQEDGGRATRRGRREGLFAGAGLGAHSQVMAGAASNGPPARRRRAAQSIRVRPYRPAIDRPLHLRARSRRTRGSSTSTDVDLAPGPDLPAGRRRHRDLPHRRLPDPQPRRHRAARRRPGPRRQSHNQVRRNPAAVHRRAADHILDDFLGAGDRSAGGVLQAVTSLAQTQDDADVA
jgi:hypothetical protein